MAACSHPAASRNDGNGHQVGPTGSLHVMASFVGPMQHARNGKNGEYETRCLGEHVNGYSADGNVYKAGGLYTEGQI